MLNIQKFLAFFAVFQCLQHCLAQRHQDQLWGVRLFTGDKEFAGTKNDVYLKLKGTKGFSLEKKVFNLVRDNQRQRNMVDYYYLHFKDVGELQAIHLKIGSEKNSWFLKRVELEKIDRQHTTIDWRMGAQTKGLSSDRKRTFYVFDTMHWFVAGEMKSFDVTEITTDRTFILRVVTSDMDDAGTASQAYIQFYNDELEVASKMLEIKYDDDDVRAPLRMGGTDTFQYTTKHIGIPTGVKMWFKRQAVYPDRLYRLDRIELEDIESDGKRRIYTFRRWDWMRLNEEKLYKIPRSETHLAVTYGLKILTTWGMRTTTDSPVSIKLIGDSKSTRWVALDNPGVDDFEYSNKTADFFVITVKDVGVVRKFTLKLEGWDNWNYWMMHIELPLQEGWQQAYLNFCQCWVEENKPVTRSIQYLYEPKIN